MAEGERGAGDGAPEHWLSRVSFPDGLYLLPAEPAPPERGERAAARPRADLLGALRRAAGALLSYAGQGA